MEKLNHEFCPLELSSGLLFVCNDNLFTLTALRFQENLTLHSCLTLSTITDRWCAHKLDVHKRGCQTKLCQELGCGSHIPFPFHMIGTHNKSEGTERYY